MAFIVPHRAYAAADGHLIVSAANDALFAKLREKFTEPQLVELTAALAWENYRARFDHAFGVEAEGFAKGSFCVLAARAAHA